MTDYLEITPTDQWFWRMDWCKRQGLSPAHPSIWDMSGREFEKWFINTITQAQNEN